MSLMVSLPASLAGAVVGYESQHLHFLSLDFF